MIKLDKFDETVSLTSNEVTERFGVSVKSPDPHKGDSARPITHVYFTYIRVNSNDRQHLYVAQYFEEFENIPGQNIDQKEEFLFMNARKSREIRTIQPKSYDFGYMDFVEHDCYFVLLIDERDWMFHPVDKIRNVYDDTIIFRQNKVNVIAGKAEYYKYDPNDAFFSYERMDQIDPDDRTKRDKIRMIFRSNGPYFGPLVEGQNREIIKQYSLDIYIKAPFFNGGLPPRNWLTVVFDPPVPNPGPPSVAVV